MEIVEQGNDQLSHAYGYFLGKGKDLLIGWLVGRAGADLGLAQALAATYAERGGREAEVALAPLTGATREQPHMLTATESSIKDVEERLESKIQETHDQLTKQREMLQSWYTEIREAFRTELSVVQGELVQVRDRSEAQHSTNVQSIENLSITLGDLQGKLKEDCQRSENADAALGQVKAEVSAIAERLAQVETTIQQVQASASSGSQDMQHTLGSLNSEIDALKVQLARLPAALVERPEFLLRELEERLEGKIQETHHQLTKAREDSEIRDAQLERSLRTELALVQAAPSDNVGTESLIRGLGERLDGSIHHIETRLAGALEMLNSHAAEISTLKAQARTLPFAPCPETSLDAPISYGISEGQSKDQFHELLHRISTEIERLRTDPKENNGRWKIRKGAFHV